MTLPEIMVTSAIFTLAVAGFFSLHLFALRMNEIGRTKLGASDDARKSVSAMVAEIRTAGLIRIGNGDAMGFTEVPVGQPQQGNAVQIYPIKGDTNNFIRYFRDDNDSRLKRTANGDANVSTVANAITNQFVFASENYKGQVLSNNFNNRVIGVTLQFYQIEFPTMPIGPSCLYDFYQLRTKITRRALE